MTHHKLATWLPLMALLPGTALAQVETERPDPVEGAAPVTVEEVVVHSPSIEGNLMGESADRQVFVVLPPSYAEETERNYPVLYALHGY